MKKLIAGVVTSFVLLGCLFSACGKEEEPLTVTDCFKDFVMVNYYMSSHPDANEHYNSNVSLSELMKADNSMQYGRFSSFQIFTTEKAAQIEVTSISFDVDVEQDCYLEFGLSLAEDEKFIYEKIEARAGELKTITFDGLHKRWTEEEAGASRMKDKWEMLGEPSTYILIELLNREDFYPISYEYSVRNLKIEFEEL